MRSKNLHQYLIRKFQYADTHAFSYKHKGNWKKISFKTYIESANLLAKSLIDLGVIKNTKVASITLNRPEWNILDLALLQIGAIHISIFPNFNLEDISHSLKYTDSEYLFVSGKLLMKQIDKLKLVNKIFSFDELKGEKNILKNLIDKGKTLDNQKQLNAYTENIALDDVASIYLTSGTSGKSKGVVVTHKAIMKTIEAMKSLYTINSSDKALSFAPLCVSSERSLNYYYQSHNICTFYTESMEKIVENMQEVKPTIFLGAPVLLEKIREKIFEKSKELNGIKAIVFNWALGIATNYSIEGKTKNKIQYKIADKLIFSKLRQIMGGQVRFIMAGGAAIPNEVNRFFWALDIPVYEGYGLSECHIVSVNRDRAGIKFGTVGTLFGETEVLINENGEIVCKSPYMFKEYYKMKELTSQSFDKFGFFKTGDKGEWIDNKYLKVIGRVKDIFKIKTGRYISPAYVEKFINSSKYISQSIVIGANRSFISAIIIPAFEYYKTKHKQSNCTNKELLNNKHLVNIIQEEINITNKNFIKSEKIASFKLLEHNFTITKGELTPSSKLKRHIIEEKYQKTINNIYDN